MKLNNCLLTKYSLNKKNSVKAQPSSLDYPGNPAEIALNITEICYEAKTSEIKSIKIGQVIEFIIRQDITLSIPNEKTKEYDDLNTSVEGVGSGEIVDISLFDSLKDDNEYQEIVITLINGYSEYL